MPSHRLARSTAAALLAACIALPAAGVEGFLFTREVQVPTSGWVRVPLDLPAVQHLASGGADLHVFAPGGTEVALRVAPAARRSELRAVTVVKVEKGEGGWTLLLDVGAEPAPHERLFFALSEMTAAPSVRLDGSSDGRTDKSSWHPLATGDMFRIGEREGLQQISLSYPSTEDRYLRLAWPQSAGFPRVEAVEVETVSGPSLAFATRGAECQAAGPSATACALALPAPGQVVRRLTLDVEGPGAVGFRLYAAQDGTWQLLHEGTWQRAGSRTQHFVDGAPEPLAGSVLRLELFGAGKTAPRLTGWGVDLAAQTVVFQAEVPGRYVLAYGGAVRRNHRGDEPPAGAETAWLTAGPEKEQAAPAPEGVEETGALGAPLGRARFDSSWTVIAPSAKAGDLVRLELPDVVYVNARPDLGDVRLALGQEQIPFFRWTPPEPALAGGQRGLHPAPVHRAGESEAEVTLPAAGLPLTEMVLTTPGGPLRRMVGVRYLEPIRRSRLPRLPDDPRERQPVAHTLWECSPEPPLPCREALPLPGAAPKILSVRLDDGDNPPLAALDAELWRRRDVLLFVWPQAAAGHPEAVRLLAGSERLAAPAYDFATLGEELLARPWQPADLDLEGTVPKAGGKPWTRWAMPVALALAGVFLLLLLRRILAEH
jgi:hypothetical protein